MMKKALVLFAAMAMVFAFAMPAAAHQACCEDCGKCNIGTIDCPVSSTAVNAAGVCQAYFFDYDDTSSALDATAVASGAIGYSTDNEGCKVLFDICCCEDVSAFVSGNTIGIRMTSLTDGFYFTADEIFFTTYENSTDACAAATMAATGNIRTFGTDYNYWSDRARTYDTFPAPKDNDCDPLYKPLVKETECGDGYLLQEADIDDAFCWWWIDMPAMKYDEDDAVRGASVLVKIELLSAENPGTICDDCAVVCECTVDLGIYCPETVTEPDECCVLFPYVLTQSSPWVTGITLINMNPAAVAYGDMEVVFTLVDATGTEFTYTKDDFASDEYVWTFSLDAILAEFSGVPAAGRAYLKATANFMINGYMFLSNGNYAGGTYAADCNSPCQRDLD